MIFLYLILIHVWFLSSFDAEGKKNCGGKYQIFDQCGDYYCNPRCSVLMDRYLNPGPVCLPRKPPNCSPGWMCINGYVNDTRTGNCIKEQYCAQVEDKHTHFEKCGAACQLTCNCKKRRRCKGACYCPPECEPGYVCNRGYVRNNTGWCVKPDSC